MMNRASVVCAILLLSACGELGDPEDGEVTSTEPMELRIDPDDPPEPLDCDDGNECTVDFANGRICRHRRVADGTACDGNICDGVATCRAGSCQPAGPGLTCDDGNACTDESCDPSRGCVYTDNTAPCSDGSSCSVGDACSGGACVGLGSTSGTIVPPSISDVAVSAALPSEVLARGSIYYLAGDSLDLELTVPSCAYVTSVHYGAATLTTAPRLACGEFEEVPDCERRYYTIESDVLGADGSRRLRLRLHLLAATGDGAGTAASVTVSSALGDTSHAFTVARVADVSPPRVGVSVSANEIHNAFLAGVYARFGDTGQYRDEDHPEIVKSYDPDYNSTWITAEDGGLRVSMEFSAEVNNWCNPRVYVGGRYRLDVINGTVRATRVSEDFDVHFDYAWYCDALPGFNLLVAFATGLAEDEVVDSVDGAMQSIADGLCGDSCAGFLVSTAAGEIRLETLNAFDVVAVDVKYEPRGARFPSPFGLPVAAGETLVIAAQNVTSGCDTAVWPNETCWGAGMGPRGVPNRLAAPGTDAAMPIPDPNWFDGTTWHYVAERAEARAELRTLARSPSDLPRPTEPVGVLLGKLASSGSTPPLEVGTGPCRIVTAGSDLLGLGPNERTTTDGRVLGKGTRRVNVVFNPAIEGLPLCQ